MSANDHDMLSSPPFERAAAVRVLLVAVAVAVCVGFSAAPFAVAAPGNKIRNHFDSDAPLREPAFFDFVVLGTPGEAQWKVISEYNPPSAPNAVSQVLTERPPESIGTALRRNVRFADGTISVGIKKLSGHAGLVFRMSDDKNFLALLIDPSSGEARLIRSDRGRTSNLAQGKFTADHDWGTLAVTLAGPKVTATWNGKPLLEASNVPSVEGRVGLATAGPGLMTFDELVIEPN